MIEVVLPGTGGMVPLENRWLSCCLIKYMGTTILIDCGEGTQIALKKTGHKLSNIDILLITHFHADHIAGLPGLLLSLGNNGKRTPLNIIGSEGIKSLVSSLLVIAPVLPFEINYTELNNKTIIPEIKGMNISYIFLNHNMPCLGYLITVNRKPVFNPIKAEKLDVPKHLYKVLHNNESIILNNGRVITPDMVIDKERNAVRICYCTDSLPIPSIIEFARDSDLFICEGMYGDDEIKEKTHEKYHMVF